MMHRRGFLGSAIGLVAATQLPFVAKAVTAPRRLPQKLEYLKQFVRMFEISEEQLMKYKMYAVTDKNQRFFVAVKSVVRRELVPEIVFQASEINVYKSLTMKGCGIFTDEGVFLMERNFVHTVPMCSGDQLRFTHTMAAG